MQMHSNRADMAANRIIELLERSPFVPLSIYLADGRVVSVDHPFEISVAPHAPDCIVHDLETVRYISIRNIIEIASRIVEPPPDSK